MHSPDRHSLVADRRGGARAVAYGTLVGTALVGVAFYVLVGAFGGLAAGLVAALFAMVLAFVPVLLAAVVVNSAVVVVNAYEKKALTVLGEYRKLLEPGINLVPPFVSSTTTFDMRTHVVDVPEQEAITEDNSPVIADAVVYIRVMDAKRAFLEVEDYADAVSNLAQTTLRAVIGDMELDDTLHRRREINARIREEIAEPTDQWGVRVESVEVQRITPTRDVLESMEQQTGAERRRRAMILEAQGERRSDVERAKGDRQSNVLAAQGEKQAQILEAQGDAISTVLRARSAESMGERAVVDKGLETLAGIGQGESTTYVLPQETTSLLGRYGRHLTGSDLAGSGGDGSGSLESKPFDAEDRETLGLDDIGDIVEGIDPGNGGHEAGEEFEFEDVGGAEEVEFDDVGEAEDVDFEDVGGAGDVGEAEDVDFEDPDE